MRKRVLRNFSLKVLAALFAALTWLVLQDYQTTGARLISTVLHPTEEREFVRPIAVLTAASAARALQVDPPEARVILSGQAASLRNLDPLDVEVYAKLTTGFTEGSFPLEVNAPPGFTARAVPDRVLVRVAPPKAE
jgi:hypothetical protein